MSVGVEERVAVEVDVWGGFKDYEKLLWKVVWTWIGRFGSRFEPQELFNELSLAYPECRAYYRGLEGREFSGRLWRTCWNRLVDLVRREKVKISIDDVVVEASGAEWKELWGKFFLEDLCSMLQTEEGRLVVGLVLDHTEELERVRMIRRPVVIRQRSLCKEDIGFYLVHEYGWDWKRVWRGFRDVEQAVRSLY